MNYISTDGIWIQFGFSKSNMTYGVKNGGWFNMMRVLKDISKIKVTSDRFIDYDAIICKLGNIITPFVHNNIIDDKYRKIIKLDCDDHIDPIICAEKFMNLTANKINKSKSCWSSYKLSFDDMRFIKSYGIPDEFIAHDNLYDMYHSDHSIICSKNEHPESAKYIFVSPCYDETIKYIFIPFTSDNKPIIPSDFKSKINECSRLAKVLIDIIADYTYNLSWYDDYNKWKTNYASCAD